MKGTTPREAFGPVLGGAGAKSENIPLVALGARGLQA